jgi:hypothetical protein
MKKVIRSISLEREVDDLLRQYDFMNWSKIANRCLKEFLKKNKEALDTGLEAKEMLGEI